MFTKLVRIGRDAEMKTTPSGTLLLEMSAVYDIGFGDKKKSQWVKIAMFGQRAEKLVSHFTKGKQIVATMDDVKSEAWISNGEAKSGMSAKLVEFEFAGGGQPAQGGQQQYNAPQQAPQQQCNAPQQQAPQMAPAYQPVPQNAPQQQAPQSWGNAPQQQGGQQQAQGKVTNHPSMDFDDDIPFAPIGKQYPPLLLAM